MRRCQIKKEGDRVHQRIHAVARPHRHTGSDPRRLGKHTAARRLCHDPVAHFIGSHTDAAVTLSPVKGREFSGVVHQSCQPTQGIHNPLHRARAIRVSQLPALQQIHVALSHAQRRAEIMDKNLQEAAELVRIRKHVCTISNALAATQSQAGCA